MRAMIQYITYLKYFEVASLLDYLKYEAYSKL